MKSYKSVFTTIFLIIVVFSGCNKNILPEKPMESDVLVYLSMEIPKTGTTTKNSKKAVSENEIDNVHLLLFENTGSGYEYVYRVPGYSITANSSTQYDFHARITPTDNPLKIYIIANAPTLLNTVTTGMSEEQVRTSIYGSFTAQGFDGTLPMFGEIELTTGIDDDEILNAVMLRSIARADIQNGTSNFILTSTQIFRASDRFQVIPDSMDGNKVEAASIPPGTTQTVNTPKQLTTANASVGQIYLPESPLPAEADRKEATVIVIGGLYENDTDTTYYRLDFIPFENQELYGQILRNHRYIFTIDSVMAPGWRTPEEASNYYSSSISVVVKVWDESTVNMSFDDVYFFGVSARRVFLNWPAGSAENISVDTNVDSYVLYWADAAGNALTGGESISLGESFTDADSLFTVSISNDGTQISVAARTSNNSGSPVTRYLLGVAGRLNLRIDITQQILQLNLRAINIINSKLEIGSLGNYVITSATLSGPGDRTGAMVNMIRDTTNNFGPSAFVSMGGFTISGLGSHDFYSAEFLELFHVVYLTYSGNPSTLQSQNILNWLAKKKNRVLIIQYDNIGTNTNILNLLGLTKTELSGSLPTPYSVYSNPPSQIMNGVFGDVDSQFDFRSFDNTHGEINLNTAITNGISPILLNFNNNMVLGIDFDRRIVFSGDIDMYNGSTNPPTPVRLGEFLPADGSVPANNNAAKLIANMWAWIATIVLTD